LGSKIQNSLPGLVWSVTRRWSWSWRCCSYVILRPSLIVVLWSLSLERFGVAHFSIFCFPTQTAAITNQKHLDVKTQVWVSVEHSNTTGIAAIDAQTDTRRGVVPHTPYHLCTWACSYTVVVV